MAYGFIHIFMQIYIHGSGAQSVVVNAQFMALFFRGSDPRAEYEGSAEVARGKAKKLWPKVCLLRVSSNAN